VAQSESASAQGRLDKAKDELRRKLDDLAGQLLHGGAIEGVTTGCEAGSAHLGDDAVIARNIHAIYSTAIAA